MICKSFPKNLLMIATVEYMHWVSSSRLQKEHSESCKIANQYSILFRNKTYSNLYWKTQIVVSTVGIRGRR